MSITASKTAAGGTADAVYPKIAKRILPLLTLLFVVATSDIYRSTVEEWIVSWKPKR